METDTRRILIAAALLMVCQTAQAQHLGSRLQWQPQTENDPRLQQPVNVEIIGRAAVTGLPILSEKTGVTLTVAPEDLATVGERKFTVIAQGCTLKAIMVQLCEALQECHWDVEGEGYLLHRNGGVDEAAGRRQDDGASVEAEQREARAARLEAVKKALGMTPVELAELEKTEPVLARVVRDPRTRTLMEGICSLSQDDLVQFVENGGAGGLYLQLSTELQEAADLLLESYLRDLQREDKEGHPTRDRLLGAIRRWQDKSQPISSGDPSSLLVVTVSDSGSGFGSGIHLGISFRFESDSYEVEEPVIPARYLSIEGSGYASHWLRLLLKTGVSDEATAWGILRQNEREPARIAREQLEARRKAEWLEPTDPDLLQVVKLAPGRHQSEDWQRSLAAQSGLSVVADHFSGSHVYATEEMVTGLPLWRMLYLLGESILGEKRTEWRKVGRCLVFRDLRWYQQAQLELPESLLSVYREKLKERGYLTLDDLASFVGAFGDRPALVPFDLVRAGLASALGARGSLRLYASLSPLQLASARSDAGLLYSEMTSAQQRQMRDLVRKASLSVAPEEISQSAFLVSERTRLAPSSKTLASTTVRFTVRCGARVHEEEVTLRNQPPQ